MKGDTERDNINTTYSSNCYSIFIFDPTAVALVIVELGARSQAELVGAIIDTIDSGDVNLFVLEVIKYNYLVFQRLNLFQVCFDVMAYPILSAFPSPSKLVFSIIYDGTSKVRC